MTAPGKRDAKRKEKSNAYSALATWNTDPADHPDPAVALAQDRSQFARRNEASSSREAHCEGLSRRLFLATAGPASGSLAFQH